MERIKKGDFSALTVLYDKYNKLLFNFAKKFVHNTPEAEDIVQELFLKVWNKSDLYDSKRTPNVAAWLLHLCKNIAIDHLRKSKKSSYLDESELSIIPDISVNVENDVQVKVMRHEIRKSLYQLPVEQREIIELIYFGGMTQSEVSTIKSLPKGTVKSRVRLAMSKLKTLLSDTKTKEAKGSP